jgi:hypothetical protein
MSDNDKQQIVLMAIQHLKVQYKSLQNPCIVLLISRHYRLLSDSCIDEDKREVYANDARRWLTYYIKEQNHSIKLQTYLNDFVFLREPNCSVL